MNTEQELRLDPVALEAARRATGTIPGAAYWDDCARIITAYLAALPPAVAAGGVTIDADLLAKQSTIEPDIAAVVYADRSKLYSDFSGGVTEEQVLAACPAICEGTSFGITWENLLWCISQEQDPIKRMVFEQKRDRVLKIARAALLAALAVGDEGIRPDLLAEMTKHPGWSIERGYRDRGDDEGGPYGWCVYDVRGGRSDLEWDLIGFGETPHEALSAAVAALPTPPSRGAGV